MKRRIWERDTNNISLSDADKARNLLADLRMDEVEEISKAASTFFAWVSYFLLCFK